MAKRKGSEEFWVLVRGRVTVEVNWGGNGWGSVYHPQDLKMEVGDKIFKVREVVRMTVQAAPKKRGRPRKGAAPIKRLTIKEESTPTPRSGES